MSKAPGGGTEDETVQAVAGMGELRAERRPRYLQRLFERLGPGTGVVLGFLLIVVIGGLVSPYFLTQRNITNVLLQTAMLGAVAAGMTFVILTAGIDLSVGTVLSLCSVVAALLFSDGQGYPLAIVLLATLALGALIGAINAAIVIWRGVAPFIVTLGMMAIASGAALTVSNGRPIGGITDTYAWLGAGFIGPMPVPVGIMLVIFALGGLVLQFTPYGRQVYAVGGNEEAARLSGISVNRVKLVTYVISGLSAALGGIIFSARVTVGDPWAGRGVELDAIAAVVIGGTSLFGGVGTMWGTLLGALIISMINNLLNLLNVSPYMQGIAKGLIILIAIAIYKKRTG
jgi:ribose/xylose/arabinose/galactoside ABC-type transport system permease subunit